MHESIRRLARPLLPIVGSAVIFAACVGTGAVSPTPPGNSGPPASPSPSTAPSQAPSTSPSTSPGTGSFSHPSGASDLVFRLDIDGGLIAPGSNLGHVPQISVYGDGLVVMPGVQTMIYPPTGAPEPRGRSAVGGRPADAARRGPGRPACSAGRRLPGQRHRRRVHGQLHGRRERRHPPRHGAGALMESQGTDGLDTETIAARAALLAFAQRLGELADARAAANQITDLGAYGPDRLRLIVSPMPTAVRALGADRAAGGVAAVDAAGVVRGTAARDTSTSIRCGTWKARISPCSIRRSIGRRRSRPGRAPGPLDDHGAAAASGRGRLPD